MNSRNSGGDWPRRTVLYVQDKEGPRSLNVLQKGGLVIELASPPWSNVTKKLEDISASIVEGISSIEVIARLFSDLIEIERLYVPLNPEASGPSQGHLPLDKDGVDYISYLHFLNISRRDKQVLLKHGAPPLISDGKGNLFLPSSGESTILSLLTSIFVEASDSTLILIDEPETNLHPSFITILMNKLADILLATNSLAVVATHSPFVVRELDKCSVTIMKRGGERGAQIFFPTLQTHGASVAEISSYVFDDDDSRKGFETAIEAISIRNSLSKEETVRMAFKQFGTDGVNFALSRELK
jgi:hypothetical protein